MNRTTMPLFLAALLFCNFVSQSHSAVDWQPGLSLKTDRPPLDTAITPDGKWTFVLTEGGQVSIYGEDGSLDDTIPVSPEMDRIATNGSGEKIILTSRHTNSIQQINLSFVANINTEGAPSLGLDNAPVEVVIFSDFQCPYCAKVGALLEYTLEHNPETVRIIFKQFPLSFHKHARAAAVASLAAQNQGKFWEMHDLLFQHGKELNDDKIMALAEEAGLNMKQFEADISNALLHERVGQDIEDGQRNGVRGTPTILVNGRLLKERSPQGLQTLVDRELARTTANKEQ